MLRTRDPRKRQEAHIAALRSIAQHIMAQARARRPKQATQALTRDPRWFGEVRGSKTVIGVFNLRVPTWIGEIRGGKTVIGVFNLSDLVMGGPPGRKQVGAGHGEGLYINKK